MIDSLELRQNIEDGFDNLRIVGGLMMSIDADLPLSTKEIHGVGFMILKCIRAQLKLIEVFFNEQEEIEVDLSADNGNGIEKASAEAANQAEALENESAG